MSRPGKLVKFTNVLPASYTTINVGFLWINCDSFSRCIIAMGLDKKPTPPPRRVKEAESDQSVVSPKETPVKDAERTDTSSHTDCESQGQETVIQKSGARAGTKH